MTRFYLCLVVNIKLPNTQLDINQFISQLHAIYNQKMDYSY